MWPGNTVPGHTTGRCPYRNDNAGSVRLSRVGPNIWFASTPKLAGTPAGAGFPLTAFLITWVIGRLSVAGE